MSEVRVRAAWESFGPAAEVARRYREQGWWRNETFSEELRSAAAERPDEPALLTWRHREDRLVALSFGELDARADSVAGALRDLGVRRGDVVAYQLPAWWEAAVLVVACLRAGAVVAPLPMLFGGYETERVLASTGAVACVVPEEWEGVPYARQLLEQAARLPALRHRIVIGDATATSAVSLHGSFHGEQPTGTARDLDPLGADEVCALLMTSGTTSETQIVVCSPNTLGVGVTDWDPPVRAGEVFATTSGLSHLTGYRQILRTISARTPTVFSDSRDPGCWLRLIEDIGVTRLLWAAPQMLRALAEEQRCQGRDVSSLLAVHSVGGPLSAQVVAVVRETLCPVVLNNWGMTEAGNLIGTATGDPGDWAGRSLGRPRAWAQIRLEPVDGKAFRLHVRGPALCLATVGRDSGQVKWSPSHDDGWLDTGDLVEPDGAGGLRFAGRVAERIGDAWQIPVADIEDALLTHPDIDDVVLVPWPHADGRETACAVVISQTRLELRDVRDHVAGLGFHESHLPTRIEHVTHFPRTELGKVRRKVLLGLLAEAAGPTLT